jgi:preprotein translocase subunit SecE
MLVLAVTFLAAVYLYGPNLLARWIVSFVAPQKSAPTNRGEEITHAVLWASIPLGLAIFWVWSRNVLPRWGHWATVDNVYVCFNGPCSGADRTNFPASLRGVLGMNWSLLWREYLVVVAGAAVFSLLIRNFGWLRRHTASPALRVLLARLVTPRIADWHIWLSDMLLPEEGLTVVVDVLTKNQTLYQGTVGKKTPASDGSLQALTLDSDGSLQALTLSSPRRYLRDEYRKALAANPAAEREAFWRPIPGDIFILLGSDIINMNVHYVKPETKPAPGQLTQDDRSFLRDLTSQVPDFSPPPNS